MTKDKIKTILLYLFMALELSLLVAVIKWGPSVAVALAERNLP